MSGARGIVGGLLGLTLLDAALTTKFATGGAGAVGGALQAVAKAFDYWLDRSQPLIPAWHSCSSSSGGGGGGWLGDLEDIGGGVITLNPGQVIKGAGNLI